MMNRTITRDEAWALLQEHVHTATLLNHALAVESVMRYAAQKMGGDPEVWGVVGLCHDIDFEEFPDQHCTKVRDILQEALWPEELIRAIESHGWGICSEVEPKTDMEKVLYTIDELTGLVAATALVRPSKSILDMGVKSVKKKWKAKAFSAGVDRSVIERGAQMLQMEVSEVIQWTIDGMRPKAQELGLAGSAAD